MFKAKLIEDEHYNSFKRKQLLLISSLFVPLVLFICLFPLQFWVKVIFAIGYIHLSFMLFKNSKSIRSTLKNRRIEINERFIRIIDSNNKELELYRINELSEITVMEEYKLPQEKLREIIDEIFGKYKINFIRFIYQKESKQFNFEIDSILMLKRLNEIIISWSSTGVRLKKG